MAKRRQSRRQTSRSLVREQNARSESKHLVVQSPADTRDRWALAAAGCAGALFAFAFFKNAWLCDDFWIITRQVEQLFAGNGLRWNPHERIQLFTSVIGFFLGII